MSENRLAAWSILSLAVLGFLFALCGLLFSGDLKATGGILFGAVILLCAGWMIGDF